MAFIINTILAMKEAQERRRRLKEMKEMHENAKVKEKQDDK